MGVFPHLWPPKIFFQKSGSVTFVPLWCPNFMQKIRKNQWAVSEIFKDGLWTTDQRTDGQGRLLRTPSGKPGVKNRLVAIISIYSGSPCWHWIWLDQLRRRIKSLSYYSFPRTSIVNIPRTFIHFEMYASLILKKEQKKILPKMQQ